ncbi:MAG: DUF2027 domain-containing protein [Bacteroidales bacterium]|nr:DUF2027 domain-containing protein [Bacteroidales bacterium]
MYTFKPGDKVRFLNEVGGGIISRIIDSKMALVAIEDGFEIPVMMNELIQLEASRSIPHATDALQKEIMARVELEEKKAEEHRRDSLRRFAREPEPEGFYLAFVPHEQQWILTGPLDVTLINHSPAEAMFLLRISLPDKLVTVDSGKLKPYSKLIVETISRDDLNEWCKGYVQVIFVPDSPQQLLLPLHAPFDLKPSRFYKEGSYNMVQVTGEKAVLVQLQLFTNLKADSLKVQPAKNDSPAAEATVKVVKEKALIDRYRKGNGEAVVDLHIGELVDNIAGLSSHDMFKIQMDHFHKTLHSAIANDYEKVTYIHGVGNGVLKNAIIKALQELEGINNKMASMSKFGVGAIDVLIQDKAG